MKTQARQAGREQERNPVLDHFPKLYLRTAGNVPLSTDDYPLAYAVPYEDTAAGRKQQERVTSWAQRNVWDPVTKKYLPTPATEAHVIDNVALSGYSFGEVISRHTTDNKVFEIRDPRGFTLQIYAHNLMTILNRATIVNGVIQEKLLWGRGGGNVLAFDYQVRPASEKKSGGLNLGDRVEIAGFEYVFVGTFFMSSINCQHTSRPAPSNSKYWPSYSSYEYYSEVSYIQVPKKVWVFQDEKGQQVIYKSTPKHVHLGTDSTFEPVKLGQRTTAYGRPDRISTAGSGDYRVSVIFLFEDKKSMEDHSLTDDEMVKVYFDDQKSQTSRDRAPTTRTVEVKGKKYAETY
jgi:hypothetical protein